MAHSLETFFGAWATADAEAIKSTVVDNIYYVDPNTPEPVNSSTELVDYVAMFSKNMAGGAAQVVDISEHHNHVRATVNFMKDGNPMMRGQYFADLDAKGVITRLVGFTGTGDA